MSSDLEVLIQQVITGLANGMIIALISLGYTMVYGIIELINFAHGDLFMLGAFFSLTLLDLFGFGILGVDGQAFQSLFFLTLLLILVPLFCGTLNVLVEKFAYRPLLRKSTHRLAPLVSAIGVSFIFLNLGLFWGGLPLKVFSNGSAASAPKDFPALVSGANLLGDSFIMLTMREVLVAAVTIPLLIAVSAFIKFSRTGKAMRAVSQNSLAAQLMGINVEQIISRTFFIGGALGGFASVIYSLYNNTIYFQMGFRVGIDAFTAAVVGGIGNFYGALLGGLLIGIVRAFSDQYLQTAWTNVVVFSILVLVLVFRPAGLLGRNLKEKV